MEGEAFLPGFTSLTSRSQFTKPQIKLEPSFGEGQFCFPKQKGFVKKLEKNNTKKTGKK